MASFLSEIVRVQAINQDFLNLIMYMFSHKNSFPYLELISTDCTFSILGGWNGL